MAGRVARAQAGVRHIITGFFLGAGASGGGEAREGRAASWQATQHRNRLQACGRTLTPLNHEPLNHERHRKFLKGCFWTAAIGSCSEMDEQVVCLEVSCLAGGLAKQAAACASYPWVREVAAWGAAPPSQDHPAR